MGAGFTPGPWHVETIADGENDCAPIYGVCHAGTVCDATTVCNVLSEDDAYLIAAAPSLYGNAEFLCARLRDLEGYDGDELLRQLMGHVLPALARMEAALAEVEAETTVPTPQSGTAQ